jgi:hypothetical protein
MNDYAAYVPVLNRLDLLQAVVAAASPLWSDFTIIDNTPQGVVAKPDAIKVFRSPIPYLFTQSMNWMLEDALFRDRNFCIFMHSDAVIPDGACEKLLDLAREVDGEGRRWGVIFTHYDVLCAINPKAYESIGGYDTNFSQYFSDNDYFRRMELGGWEKIDSGIEVGHVGSQTINSDPYLRHVNGVTFPLYQEYYRQKWGGSPGHEIFIHPFGVLPREWKLSNMQF